MDTQASKLLPFGMAAFIFYCPEHGLIIAHCRLLLPKPSHSKDTVLYQGLLPFLGSDVGYLVSEPDLTVGHKSPISLIMADRHSSGFSGDSPEILSSVSGNKDLIRDTKLEAQSIFF